MSFKNRDNDFLDDEVALDRFEISSLARRPERASKKRRMNLKEGIKRSWRFCAVKKVFLKVTLGNSTINFTIFTTMYLVYKKVILHKYGKQVAEMTSSLIIAASKCN